jgi:hypothetical protein
MPVILAIQEVQIRRIEVQKPAWVNSFQDLISKILNTKWDWWGYSKGKVPAQQAGTEFKLQYHQKRSILLETI